ncbi:S49 family peptidase [Defluviimonas salinarum]|uniref:S49 family peptidase n=1 Tax=Defluviimonas salinarum TaxID=2992147 RepID=A0ABT3J976_9RHOB|nr:S49 family peptidase [Defluviimonas salinarum]MCW3784234.1 S49 family peptidase [Defluviimonas salinarum]
MHHTQIAQRVFNTPLMVDPAKALAFLAGLGPRITGGEISVEGFETSVVDQAAATRPARASLFGDGLTHGDEPESGHPFAVVDGIAVIEIAGTLVHRGAWIGQSSGLTSYEGIAAQLQAAVSDPAIRGIALDIDSFGGEVAGAFDLADRIRAARAQKPVQAFVAEHALSAGYALASQAERIILPRTGAVGSIGVLAIHSDRSAALDREGVAVTLIHAGAHKVDANPYAPLPEAVRDRIQRELEVVRFFFAETVAAGRGSRLTHAAALATEAAVYRGAGAVAAGLADEVSDPVTAFRTFAAALRGTTASPRKDPLMSNSPVDAQIQTPPAATADAPPLQAAPVASPTPAPAPTPARAPEQTPSPASAGAPSEAAPTPEAIRAEAAEVAQVCAQAARLGVQIDAADAVSRGLKPEALRARVLADLAARGDAAGILATAPAALAKESPLIAAAKKSAAAPR